VSSTDPTQDFIVGGTGNDPTVANTTVSPGSVYTPDTAGTQIGPYKLLQILGEGGFGTVWLADQREPVTRRVALKVLKPGMDSFEVLARFELERQALAMMDHPNISRVYDAGQSASGRPYFVMEYVQGVPVTNYCDAHRLTTANRLRIFIDICYAVQHAHQKGVIHRDLKPGNILVSVVEGNPPKPLVKIIDFGIAKAINTALSSKAIFTETGRLMGTPEYMSPEQAGTTSLDVDTRTDVYSLGVILYELLAGALPFDSKTLRSAGYEGIMRMIREQDPPRLSTKFSRLGDASNSAAQLRQSDSRTLINQLRGDLEWITARAMEKDRSRRYGMASDLAADIDRYLHSQPVVARPPSFTYLASKFVRRHRIGVSAASAIAAAVLLGAVGTTIGMVRAQAAHREAVAQREVAVVEAGKANASVKFLMDTIQAVDPANTNRPNITVREVVDEARGMLAASLSEQPLIDAAVRNLLGRTYVALGVFDPAEVLLNESLAARQKLLPAEHLDIAQSKNDLGLLRLRQGKLDDSIALQREALAMRKRLKGDNDAVVADSLNNLAAALREKDQRDEAIKLFREALVIHQAAHGPKHPDTITTQRNLAVLLLDKGDFAQAEKINRDILALQDAKPGQESRDLAWTLNNLAQVLEAQNKFDEALPLQRRAVDIQRRVLGPTHPDVGAAVSNLALALQSRGDLAAAEPLFREALDIARKQGSVARPDIDIDLLNLGNVLMDLNRPADAEPLARESLRVVRGRVAPGDRQIAFSALLLGRLLSDTDRAADAEPLLREALANFRANMPTEDRRIPITESTLGGALLRLNRSADAEPLLLSSYPKIAEALGPTSLRARQAAGRLADLYTAKGDAAAAEQWRARAIP